MNQEQVWAVVLAGGEGSRLRPLTRRISGDERPKQFCSLCGDHTLLAQTRLRLSRVVSAEQTMFSVVRQHEKFYGRELSDVTSSQVAVQPLNRGTAAAIAYTLTSLLGVSRLREDAIVGVFPSDHHYADEERFIAAVRVAFEISARCPSSLLLLGAEAQHPEVDYGWIEPGRSVWCDAAYVFQVRHFWEKPSPHVARMLFARGCLWNTFVMIGRVKMFLDMLHRAVPRLIAAFKAIGGQPALDSEKTLDDLYAGLPSGDFSRQVLSACTEWLTVLPLGNVGWTDLGTPERVAVATRKTAKGRAAGHVA
jgi:mannose-1-phosphate guanylyltransferase